MGKASPTGFRGLLVAGLLVAVVIRGSLSSGSGRRSGLLISERMGEEEEEQTEKTRWFLPTKKRAAGGWPAGCCGDSRVLVQWKWEEIRTPGIREDGGGGRGADREDTLVPAHQEKVGLVIRSHQCFPPRAIWHTDYKLLYRSSSAQHPDAASLPGMGSSAIGLAVNWVDWKHWFLLFSNRDLNPGSQFLSLLLLPLLLSLLQTASAGPSQEDQFYTALNQDAMLTVNFTSNSQCDVFWRKTSKAVNSSVKMVYKHLKNMSKGGFLGLYRTRAQYYPHNNTLVLNNVTEEDEGVYEVTQECVDSAISTRMIRLSLMCKSIMLRFGCNSSGKLVYKHLKNMSKGGFLGPYLTRAQYYSHNNTLVLNNVNKEDEGVYEVTQGAASAGDSVKVQYVYMDFLPNRGSSHRQTEEEDNNGYSTINYRDIQEGPDTRELNTDLEEQGESEPWH
ncbi:UNVERIFIED_CONTAM: hypothetical protein FKN15_059464 [Acipenser sinensis]